MKYVAMINMPGCIPDSEPCEFETSADALAYLHSELLRWYDDGDNSEEEYSEVKKHLSLHGYCYFQNYYFGVNEL